MKEEEPKEEIEEVKAKRVEMVAEDAGVVVGGGGL